jgi:hypothetical protein
MSNSKKIEELNDELQRLEQRFNIEKDRIVAKINQEKQGIIESDNICDYCLYHAQPGIVGDCSDCDNHNAFTGLTVKEINISNPA